MYLAEFDANHVLVALRVQADDTPVPDGCVQISEELYERIMRDEETPAASWWGILKGATE